MHNNKELVETLAQCAAMCEYCADACIDENNVKKMIECIRLDKDCADICRTAINYIARDSQRASDIIEICAKICAECTEECEKHEHDHCKECAEACRKCEEACKSFASV